MGKAEMILLGVVALTGLILIIKMMVSLINKYGTTVKRGRKKTKEEELGYKPSKAAGVGVAVAMGSFLCGVLTAIKPFRGD